MIKVAVSQRLSNFISIAVRVSFVFALFFSLTSSASAATYYVSQTVTNGYAVGSDSNTAVQAQSKATPWLTVKHALSQITTSGNTLVINDGTYSNQATGYFITNTTGSLTINPETPYGTTLVGTSTNRVLYQNSGTTSLTLGSLVIDATSTAAYGMQFGGAGLTLNINGTKFQGFTGAALYSANLLQNLTMSGGWSIIGTGNIIGVQLVLNQAGAISISNGTFTVTGSTLVPQFLNAAASVTGVSLVVHDITATVSGSGASNYPQFAPVSGFSSYDFYNNNVTFSGNNKASGILITPAASLPVSHAYIYGNTLSLGAPAAASGSGIQVGDDGNPPTNSNNISDIQIYNNTVSGANHLIEVAAETGSGSGITVWGNTVTDGTLGVILKNCVSMKAVKNVAQRVSGKYWRIYTGTNVEMDNNLAILDSGYASYALYADVSSPSALFKNNIIYGTVQLGSSMVYVEPGSTATFANNNYYSAQGFASDAFNYTGTGYGTLAAWQTAHESTAMSANPLFVNFSGGNYALSATSTLIDAGTSITGLTTDRSSNPIYGTLDIGPYEYQPTYVMGTDNIGVSGSVRTYKDGYYGYTTATSSSPTANLTITPVGGFPTGDYSEWLNISLSTWNTSGNYSKTWTESSSVATSTAHTVGDLQANTYYTVSVDGSQYTTAQSNGSGQITFTYSGGYSSHTFTVAADTTGPVAFSLISPAGTTGASTQTFSWSPTTDSSSGLAKYQLYADGALKEDNIATTSTQTSASGFSCGDHTWFVRATDNAGNTTDSNLQTFTVGCGGGGIFTGSSFSLPGYVIPRPQIITPDGKVTYLNETASTTAKVITSPPIKEQGIKTSTIAFTRTLKKGLRGSDVIMLQEFLKKDPLIYPEGLVTGYFGILTENATKQFQKKYSIVSSGTPGTTGYGLVGPKTRAKLNVLIGE